MPFKFSKDEIIPDLIVIEPQVFSDERGWFLEVFKTGEFKKHGIPATFAQTSHSYSLKKDTVRGLHFQRNPQAQGKLVRCLAGEVFDVAVDLRRGSPTYKKWKSVILSAANKKLFWIPTGFAHGVCALVDGAELEYFLTAEWSKAHERSLVWRDPELAIRWPTQNPILSAKDASAPKLSESDCNFRYKP